jgi:hypothetical protein
MSTHVTGVRDLDGQFARMIAAKLACEAAGVGYPQELRDYFGCSVADDESYHREEMESVDISAAIEKSHPHDAADAWTVDLSKLPEEVKAIRFCNRY